jgi:hypothetical protein
VTSNRSVVQFNPAYPAELAVSTYGFTVLDGFVEVGDIAFTRRLEEDHGPNADSVGKI